MKKMILLLMAGIMLMAPALSATNTTIMSNAVYLKTTLVSQTPVTAEPGSYVDLLFKLENWGTVTAENVVFELALDYPFSLDPGADALRELGTVFALQTDSSAYLIKYRVKVHEDAVAGENEVLVKYSYGGSTSANIKAYNVTVSDPKTSFEVIVQDSTTSSTTLAIANIGSNTAYSTIVRIPDQNGFAATGISASVIGNLDAGDYTLVSFQVSSAAAMPSNGSMVRPASQMMPPSGVSNSTASAAGNLVVEISYTDELGIRRTVQAEVKLSTGTAASAMSGRALAQGDQSLLSGNGLTYIVVGVVGISVIVAFFKLRGRKKK